MGITSTPRDSSVTVLSADRDVGAVELLLEHAIRGVGHHVLADLHACLDRPSCTSSGASSSRPSALSSQKHDKLVGQYTTLVRQQASMPYSCCMYFGIHFAFGKPHGVIGRQQAKRGLRETGSS